MPTYLVFARYSVTGNQGVAESGMTARRDVVASTYAAVGCTLHRMDCTVSGKWDFVQLVDAPDAATLRNLFAIAGSGGGLDTDRDVIELLDVESFDERRLALPTTAYAPAAPSR